jgi:hypothetical protein
MAENINIKVLIDAAESAKTIQDTKKALKELNSAALQVEEGSAAFQSLTTAAGQLKDRIGDLSATTAYLGDDLKNLKGLSSIGEGIAGGFAIAQGAAALFGGENKQLEASLLKVQSAMALLQGVQAIGEVLQKQSAATLFIENGLRQTKILLYGKEAVVAAELAVVEGTATEAQIALNSAMKSNPVMALVGVLVLAVTALVAFSGETKKANENQKALNDSMLKSRTQLEIELKTFNSQIEALKQLKTGSEDRAIAIKKINDQYGTTLKNLGDENLFLKQVNYAQTDYVNGAKTRIQVKINEAKIESFLTEAQIKREQSLWAAKKATEIADKNETIRKGIKGKTEIEILNSTFVSTEGIEYQRLLLLKRTSKEEADILNSRADAALSANAKLITSETAQQKAAREKEQAELVKAEADKTKTVVDAKKKTDTELQKEQKDHLAKLKDANDDYASSLKELDDFIVETNAKSYNLNLEQYQNSLNGQIDALNVAAQEEIIITTNKYDEIIKVEEEAAKAKIQAEKDAKQAIISNYDDLLAANGIYQRAVSAKANYVGKIEANLQAEITKIVREESDKRLKAQQEVAQAIIAPAEFGRFVDYLQFVEREVKATKDGIFTQIDDLRKYSSIDFVLYDYEKRNVMERAQMEKQLDMAKKFLLSYDTEVTKFTEMANKASTKLATDDMNLAAKMDKDWAEKALASLKEKHTKALAEEKSYTKQLEDELNARLSSESFNKLVENYSTRILEENKLRIEKYNEELKQYEKDKKLYDEQLKAYNLYITNKLTDTKEGQKLFRESQKENNKLVTSMPIEPILPTDKFAEGLVNMTNAIGESGVKINTALDEVANDVLGNKKLPEALKAMFGSSEATEENLKLIFDPAMVNKYQKIALQVETKNSEVFNLKMAALYQDKYKTIVGTEEEINAEREKAYTSEKENYDARVKELQDFNTKTAAEQAKMVKPILPPVPVQPKKFALSPKEGQVGIADLTEQETKKINQKLEERYALIEKAEKKWYETEFFNLYQQLQDKTITQEDYYKKMEALEEKHQQNMFDTQVVYGKKGQKDIADRDKEKYDKQIATKAQMVDEMLKLEAQLSQGIMDIVNANTDQKIAGMNQEYDLKVENIQREADAYDRSLTEQTNAELFIAEKKQAFQDEIDAQNAERAAKEKQLRQEQFNKQKAADIIQAGINGAMAFTKALALTGPYALAIQGLVAAQVASQIFFISSAENPYAEGGLVTGPGGPKDDKIRARLSNGESVINAKSTKMFAPVLSYINQAGGGKAIPSQGGGKMALGGGGAPMTVGQEPMNLDLSRLEDAINRLNDRPIETYVKESKITAAQNLSNRENRRTSF